ncbi:MAG TPA: hypothetical protein PK156_22085 [Polyangium sp.]|nr:hypothetical protein [Polyangium sp.]
MHHLTRRAFNTIILGSICAAAAILPADAHACSPPAPGLTSHLPEDGAYYPANGIVLFQGFGISLDQVTVTVNGMPGTLVDATAAFATNIAPLAARVSPKPNADENVVISGAFCTGCPTETFSFTARADDLVAPEGVISVHYGVHDYADFQSSGGDCQSDSDMAIWVDAQTSPSSEEEAPTVLQIEAFADSALTKPIGSHGALITTNEMHWGNRITSAMLEGSSPTAVCFRLSTKDLSGNEGPMPTVLCNACYTRTDAQSNMTGLPPDEPMWTDADAIQDGPCDWGAGVGGGQTEEASCSYHPNRSSSALWMLAACAAFGIGVVRTRVRRPIK